VTENQVKLAMAVLLTIVLLGAGLYVLIGDSGSSSDLQKAATG
jgi:uncharacterized protein (UPF0333 family)